MSTGITAAVLADLHACSFISDPFGRFDLVFANGKSDLIRQFGALALQVYGHEWGFESVVENQKYFLDTFDLSGHTMHTLVRHRESGIFVACVRLIGAHGDLKNMPLTSEIAACQNTMVHENLHRKDMGAVGLVVPEEALEHIYSAAEVSRFCLSEHFCVKAGVSAEDKRTLSQYLIAGIMIMARSLRIDYYLSFCDAVLRRGLMRFNVNWGEFSRPVQFNGRLRQLAGGPVEKIHPNILKNQPLIRSLVGSEQYI